MIIFYSILHICIIDILLLKLDQTYLLRNEIGLNWWGENYATFNRKKTKLFDKLYGLSANSQSYKEHTLENTQYYKELIHIKALKFDRILKSYYQIKL